MKFILNILFVYALLIAHLCNSQSPPQTGLLQSGDGDLDGYILFAPLQSRITYLINKQGKPLHSWRSNWLPAQSAYLLPDGHLLRTGVDTGNHHFPRSGGWIEKINARDQVVWSYLISDKHKRRHHDICPLPNGNILVMVWEKKTRKQALKAGRKASLLGTELWTEKVIELKPQGDNGATIVWEWNAWDHLVQDQHPKKKNFGKVSDSPERIDINYRASKEPDWLHFNAIAYNPKTDQILLCSRDLCEIYVIDHSTTSKQAASHSGGKQGHGGDILYRWGNPEAYQRGNKSDQKFFKQHNAHWIDAMDGSPGKIMVFNNGLGRPDGEYSSIDILDPPYTQEGSYLQPASRAFLPDTLFYRYTAPEPSSFYSHNISSAQVLSNGNILICEGAKGKFFEIDATKKTVWLFVNPFANLTEKGQTQGSGGPVFKCLFYESTYPGIKLLLQQQNTSAPPHH